MKNQEKNEAIKAKAEVFQVEELETRSEFKAWVDIDIACLPAPNEGCIPPPEQIE
jgi:hypothetical protein